MASIPIAPIPAQPSRKIEPSILGPRMLNIVSRNLSLVGRMPAGGVPFSRLLLNCPAIMRILVIKVNRSPLLGKEGWLRHQKISPKASFEGADGVVIRD